MKSVFRVLGFVGIIVALFSCSTTKNLAEAEQVKNKVVTSTAIDTLSENDKMQFEYLFFEALKQKTAGNIQNVVQILSRCLEIDPNSSASMYELANIHAANGDFTSASLLLEKAISIDDSNIWYKLLLAQVYQQAKKFSEAADIYTKLLQNDPENQEYIYTKAILLEFAKKYDEAINTYNLLESKAGINEQISVAKQRIYMLNGKTEKAFDEIEKLIKFNPSEPKYYGLLADLYMNEGDRENAMKNYNKIIEMDPDNGYVHFSLANIYLDDKNTEEAYKETVKGFENETVDLQTKLQSYMRMVSNREVTKINNEQEEKLIKLLLQYNPNEYIVHTVYSEFLYRNSKDEEAREQLLKALEIEKSDYMVWNQLLLTDNNLQDWDALYDHTKEVIDLFPNQPQGYFFNAVACIQLEKYEETVEIVDEGLDYVIDNKPLQGQFMMLKGEALYNQNKLDEAFEFFDKSVQLDPTNFIAMNNYAYYLSETGRDLDKAERMSAKVIERYPDNSTYLDTHAWVLFKKGEYSLAKFYMEAAIKNGGAENATLLEHYGDILFMLQKMDEAKEYWEKARDFGGESEVLDRKIRENKYFEK